MKNKIKKILKENELDFRLDSGQTEMLFSYLSRADIANFEMVFLVDREVSYMTVQYYSKIGRTIIFDHEAPETFEDIDELCEFIKETNEAISVFEAKLPKLNR